MDTTEGYVAEVCDFGSVKSDQLLPSREDMLDIDKEFTFPFHDFDACTIRIAIVSRFPMIRGHRQVVIQSSVVLDIISIPGNRPFETCGNSCADGNLSDSGARNNVSYFLSLVRPNIYFGPPPLLAAVLGPCLSSDKAIFKLELTKLQRRYGRTSKHLRRIKQVSKYPEGKRTVKIPRNAGDIIQFPQGSKRVILVALHAALPKNLPRGNWQTT
ncbi:hypothetical protein RF11_12339 [Thelohanellus kitauei]|uniref:Uncharacterized protein n=1 Tax=Thelohanellus kitauei TaxID=669202 RepID=A0A0C2JTZ8_THEKT|nr:hypothetical protein RF11_12339 [Thelohanellus kitauei]